MVWFINLIGSRLMEMRFTINLNVTLLRRKELTTDFFSMEGQSFKPNA